MALYAATVTLGGTAQSLDPSPVIPKPIVSLRIESDTGNAAVYVGKDNTVSSTVYGASILAGPAAALNIGYGDNGKFNLQDVWVTGTNGNKIRLLAVTQ